MHTWWLHELLREKNLSFWSTAGAALGDCVEELSLMDLLQAVTGATAPAILVRLAKIPAS